MNLGEKIEKWVIDNFENVNKASIAFDMPASTIHRYIEGENMPGAPFLIKMAEFGCDMNWLLKDEWKIAEKNVKYGQNLKEENEELRKEISQIKKKLKGLIGDS